MSHTDTLRALYETTRQLGLEADLETLLDEVLLRARDLIGFDHCGLKLYEHESGHLVLRRALGFADDLLGMRLERGEGLCGLAAERRESVREGDVARNDRYISGLNDARSDLVVPLMLQNHLVGVINVESRRPHAFTDEHEMLLTVLGTNAALAIVASQAQFDLREKLDRLDALYRISALSWAQEEFEEVVQAVLNETQKSLPEGDLAILLLDEEEQCLIVRQRGGYSDRVEGMKIPLGEGITGRCAVTGDVQVIDDVMRDPAYIPGVPGARSEVAVPLVADGTVIGVLSAESRRVAAYGRADLLFLSVIAREVASVLHTARLREEVHWRAISDPLTGLFNRRYFQQRLSDDLKRAKRYGDLLALAFLDLDHFKVINDTHGHTVGDRVLTAAASTIQTSARESDLVARIGGEEFAVLLQHSGESQAIAACMRMCENLADLKIDVGLEEPLRITTSVGVALYPDHGTVPADLFSVADQALYQAKHRGRNCIVVQDSETDSAVCGGATFCPIVS